MIMKSDADKDRLKIMKIHNILPLTLEVFLLALANIWILIRLVFTVPIAIAHMFRCCQIKIACTVA